MGNSCFDSKGSKPDLRDNKTERDTKVVQKQEVIPPKPVVGALNEALQKEQLQKSPTSKRSEIYGSQRLSNQSLAAFARRKNQNPKDKDDYNNVQLYLSTSGDSKAGLSFRPKDGSVYQCTRDQRLATFLNQTQAGQFRDSTNTSKDVKYYENSFSKSKSGVLSSESPCENIILTEEEKLHF
ncbi:unnamed protein product [Moneuplotes crassus]|uniref:Uncharacterized protein n=1 Tax=Euplotes crassus TaxID=5936 RepID=A0AAD2D458_EUPCR|nr:unnamed protein product [Moneuplotes crassus]